MASWDLSAMYHQVVVQWNIGFDYMFFGKNYDFIIGIYFSCTTTGCINKVKLDESIAELFGFEVTELDGSASY